MVDWIAAAIALIKLTAMAATWLERQAQDKEKFNKAVALELQAVARARAKIAGIEKEVSQWSDEKLADKLATYRRPRAS